jgi:uncharacterized protein YifE (UPF0438 family)
MKVIKMSIDSFASQSNFYDVIHFPHGFSRAGVFTIQESEVLARCGYIINQLILGNLQPVNMDQMRIIAVAKGERSPSTMVEKTWCKYQVESNYRVVKYSAMSVSMGEQSNDYEEDSDF